MTNPYDVVRQFEQALCDYTGAKYAVTTTSCTMALLIAVSWFMNKIPKGMWEYPEARPEIEIPKHTYVGVPMSIVHAGGKPVFRDEYWTGAYQLKPLPVWDAARYFTSGLYKGKGLYERLYSRDCSGKFICVSFHHTKTLGLAAHGGAILHDNDEADEWLRRARFDGRKEGVSPKDDTFPMIGFHCYMTPATAAEGLMRLAVLPKHNEPLPWGPVTSSDYADLSKLEIFK